MKTADPYPKEIKNKWTKEDFEARILSTLNDVKGLNQAINTINSEMNVLKDRKRALSNRVSKKNKYINQLRNHLADFDTNNDWKEI